MKSRRIAVVGLSLAVVVLSVWRYLLRFNQPASPNAHPHPFDP
jgi:hypothetical protein